MSRDKGLRPKDDHQDCGVCGNTASYYYHGSSSKVCWPFRAFLHNNGRRQFKYDCKCDQNCNLSFNQSTPQKRCQFCRLKKCFKFGMKYDLTRCGQNGDDDEGTGLKVASKSKKKRSKCRFFDSD